MLLNLSLSSPVHNSFRVQQIAGMFDVPLADRLTEQIQIDLPDMLAAIADKITGTLKTEGQKLLEKK